jgi:TolA-binding protein
MGLIDETTALFSLSPFVALTLTLSCARSLSPPPPSSPHPARENSKDLELSICSSIQNVHEELMTVQYSVQTGQEEMQTQLQQMQWVQERVAEEMLAAMRALEKTKT